MGFLAASIVFVRGRRRAQRIARGADVHFDDLVGTSVANENLVEVATTSGIADVDPGPLSHVAGEGIDLDRNRDAHESITDLRDRLRR
jgi:hypothetical protein